MTTSILRLHYIHRLRPNFIIKHPMFPDQPPKDTHHSCSQTSPLPTQLSQVAQAFNEDSGNEISLFTEINAYDKVVPSTCPEPDQTILFGNEHGTVEAQEAETDVKLHQDAVRKHLHGNQKMAERFAARDKQCASVMEHITFPTISCGAGNLLKSRKRKEKGRERKTLVEEGGEGSTVGGAEVEVEMRDQPEAAFNVNMDKEINTSLAAAGINI
ncbi:hypothetical protein PAXINDRAFT_12853 [Paxillus involutus ATCC 200175]|uniref:Uncharacterized protein n=1 Tax=Paxillus involutus ATCC 200175 TaxID=664439 RepID=A0A0C9TVC5_PAXIN|nr:hypothetical protein PAXINDRAFT_12853 [Paxillus involutus ATCC 200175]